MPLTTLTLPQFDIEVKGMVESHLEDIIIRFSWHAENKFEVLARHGWPIDRVTVENAVQNPETLDHSRDPLVIAQTTLDVAHVLRVVYRKEGQNILIITFYPGRKNQYIK